jgi:small subunit ribosomal protein S9
VSDITTDTAELDPEVPIDSEGPVAYTSETNPSPEQRAETGRVAVINPAGATGRRKEAVARVRLVPGRSSSPASRARTT